MLLRRAAKDDADPKLIDVQLCRARKTLRELGATGPIATPVYGFGFRLDPVAYDWIQLQLRGTHGTSA
jgi:DNA-binding response OmpR family regulator